MQQQMCCKKDMENISNDEVDFCYGQITSNSLFQTFSSHVCLNEQCTLEVTLKI